MATHQLHGISPSYERLCLGVAEDHDMLARLDTLPPPKRQPNLLLGAVRYLGGPIDSYPAFRDFVVDEWDTVSSILAARRTQTNEPRRCATLLPALAGLPQPLALLEVGASAGLCLYPDRYGYRYNAGPVLGTGPVIFDCAVSGPAPLPTQLPTVAWRAGLDLHPLDVRDADEMRWLEALVWPEQRDRLEHLRGAIALAARDPAPVRPGDLTTDVRDLAAEAPTDATLVVFHSAVLAYLTDEQRAAFRRQLDELREQRTLVWLANEGPGVVVDRPVPDGPVPFVLSRDLVPLALTAPHGQSLDWFPTDVLATQAR